jgi:Flp pilus assembly protein CpaB
VIAAADPADGGPATTSTVVRGVRVLATPTRDSGPDGDADGTAGLLIIAATNQQAAALAEAANGGRLSIAVRRQS